MIANIRVHDSGYSRPLCQLDLMKFTEEQVRDRMHERGIDDDSFFICGFEDWGVDTIMSLCEAYYLKKCINELYDGDDFIVIYQLKKHQSPSFIISHYYIFKTKDELEMIKDVVVGSASHRERVT